MKNQKISYEQALKLLVNEQGTVNLALLDKDVRYRFLRYFPDKGTLPPVIPLLLWRDCYYLGSPATLLCTLVCYLLLRNGLISDALLGVVAQRLARRVCPHCAEPYTPSETDLQLLGLEPQANASYWRKGRGCSRCFNSGYLGREAIVELLDIDDRIRELIYEGTMTQLHRYLQESNFASFRTAALQKVTSGLTTVEEVLRVIPKSALCSQSVANSLSTSLAIAT